MAQLPDSTRSRGVLIGTSEYDSDKLPALPAVRNNLADLREVLASEQGCRLPCTLIEDQPDAGEVGERLIRIAGEATDLLLVYYAGHGLTWTGRDELYLALRNTKLSSVGTSALPCSEVRHALLNSPARTRVLILDCCFSGRAFERTMADPEQAMLNQVDVDGAYVLTATQPNQLAQAPEGARHTLFTGELLRLLRKGIPEGPELLTMDTLFRELRSSLRRRNLPEPSCNNIDAAADLALARNAAHHSAGEIPWLRRRIEELEQYKQAYPAQAAQLSETIKKLSMAEDETERIYAVVRDKILHPTLASPSPHAPALSGALRGLDRLEQHGRWTELAGRLTRLEHEAAEALEGTRSRRAAATSLLDEREELRGRLETGHIMAGRFNLAEHPKLRALYAVADKILWTKPCDLVAAARAVEAYLSALESLINEREGRADG